MRKWKVVSVNGSVYKDPLSHSDALTRGLQDQYLNVLDIDGYNKDIKLRFGERHGKEDTWYSTAV